ncbi:MAG: methyl-accepting chemotaxis protein [Desulfobulbus sp.]|nr:methyl-accepting chemotaxis protein [Desulfobulbus sp.]
MFGCWSIGKKLIISFLSLAVVFLLCAVFFKSTIEAIRINGPLYNQIVNNKDLIADILPPPAFIIEAYLCAMEAATAENNSQQRENLLVRIKELFDGPGFYQERMKIWESNLTNQAIRSVFLHDAQQHARNFFTAALGPFSSAIRANQMDEARQIFFSKLKSEYLQHRKAIDEVVKLANTDFNALEKQAEETLSWRQYAMGFVFLAIIVFALGLGVIISRSISRPIIAGIHILERMTQGDMLQAVPGELRNRGDEVGQMATSLSSMISQLGSMIRDIVNGVNKLSASSGDLTTVSCSLLDSAHETSIRSGSVATAAEEMTRKMQSISAATEQSSANVGMIASSTEEMIATINEIAHNADAARLISEQAVNQATLASRKMESLGDSARNIGRVTEAITEISEQTNLLALNATIEAARAGEAGKGFAVVANEIKELAKQTAAATVDIKNQIMEMQTTTTSSVEDIRNISIIIDEINSMIRVIATAVDEQSTTSREIATNLAQASQGITEVNHNVTSSSLVIADISKEIYVISHNSSQVEEGSRQVQNSAETLTGLAVQLEGLVEKFKV